MLDENKGNFMYKKVKVIPVLHFWYLFLLTICAAILIIVFSIRFGDSTRAGEDLNFAATISSIILAVIAIIITIVDGANQKENIAEMKEALDVIDRTVNNVGELLKKANEQFAEINEIKNVFQVNQEWQKQMSNQLGVITETIQNEYGPVDLTVLKNEILKLQSIANYNVNATRHINKAFDDSFRYFLTVKILRDSCDTHEISWSIIKAFPPEVVKSVGPIHKWEIKKDAIITFGVEMLESNMVRNKEELKHKLNEACKGIIEVLEVS